MVAAVHAQQIRRLRDPGEAFLLQPGQRRGLLRVGGKALRVVVPEAHADGEDLRAVRRVPAKLRGLHMLLLLTVFVNIAAVIASSEDAAVHAELPEDLRQLGDEAELVRRVADAHAPAIGLCLPDAGQQIPDGGLSAGQKEVVLHVPGADQQPPVPDILPAQGLLLRADVETVLQHDGLGVQMKHIVRLRRQDLQQMVDQIGQLQTEDLLGQIPFPVPMSVGNYAIMGHVMFLSPLSPSRFRPGLRSFP